MRKKLLGLVLAALLTAPGVAAAQEVTVDGMGMDRDSAIRDATRNAVMQVAGTYIDSRTLVEQATVSLDEIYSKSRGYVQNITILSEGQAGSDYRVRAKINVNDNPNAELMNSLAMIMITNDPRISVIVLKEGGGYDESATTAINDRLIEAGFTHVVDADHIIKLNDAALLNSIYNGQRGLTGVGVDHAVDFLVLGKTTVDAGRVSIPIYGGAGMQETGLSNAQVNLNVKIMKYDTGDIIGTFETDGKAMEGTENRSAIAAGKVAARAAAVQVENKFKKFAARPTQGLQVNVTAADYDKISAFIEELRHVPGVDNVYVREHGNGKARLEIDSTHKPHTIITMLKQRTKLGIFVEGVTNSSISINVS